MLLLRLKQKPLSSIAIEIPILRPRAVMVGPRPRVLLTPPLPAPIVLEAGRATGPVSKGAAKKKQSLAPTGN